MRGSRRALATTPSAHASGLIDFPFMKAGIRLGSSVIIMDNIINNNNNNNNSRVEQILFIILIIIIIK